ncbi:MAG: trypsin-like peptidase domain-containing protein [Rhodanobacter sp.]
MSLCAANTALAATLDPAVLPTIQAATFEVVQAKPTDDPLSYEKPLPLDLLPYQERTDKYHSIGTAFAIGHNRYVTAGHVLLAGVGSLWGPPALRDTQGHVYAIDKIEKFSLREDFVVFTLAGEPSSVALDINTHPAMNQVVYAVGNALGTGVVIRDGLYTSDTPEQQDGSWKWMRFSAAASPGNSGGPLLDKDGKVIGVVLMKSANENLNYALPIGMVLDAPDNLAVLDERIPYGFDVFEATVSNIFKAQFALPKSFADFSAAYLKLGDAYVDDQLKALLAKDPENVFPHGSGSNHLLYGAAEMDDFPRLIVRNSNGDWELSGRKGPQTSLSDNGYMDMGAAGHNVLLHLRKPDNVSAKQLYTDPAQFSNQLAKMGHMQREVGPEQVKITGLGKPIQDTVYTDAWKRHWQVRVWPLAFNNELIVTYSLPVPDGYVTMMQFTSAGEKHEHLADMQALTDFIYVAYHGTLAQWKDYLQNTALLPDAFKDIQIDVDNDHRFSYTSKRLAFSFTPELQKIAPTSVLNLGFDYFNDHGKVVWDVGAVRVRTDTSEQNWINIRRNVAPPGDLEDKYKSEWQKISQRRHPFDGVALSDSDVMKITGVVNPPVGADPSVLYTAFYGAEGTQPQDAMKAKLDLLMKNVQVFEH